MGKYVLILSVMFLAGEQPLREAARLASEGNWSASIAVYRQAMDEYPLLAASISYNIGLAYLNLDEPDMAREAFFQALSPLSPNVASLASNQLGLLMVTDGRPREALSSFREALLFDPDNEEARFNYELLALRLGQNQSNQPPPPSENPPPPDEEEPQLSDPYMQQLIRKLQRRQEQIVPVGDRSRPAGDDTLTMAEAYQVLELLFKQEKQYVQQLRKVSSPSTGEGTPIW